MTTFTLTEAATMTAVSRSTINRAVKSGKMSAHRDEAGVTRVDASELARVFPLESHDPSQRQSMTSRGNHGDKLHDESPDARIELLETKVAALTAQLAQANEMIASQLDTVADLRGRLDWFQGSLAIATQVQGTNQSASQSASPPAPLDTLKRLASWWRPRG